MKANKNFTCPSCWNQFDGGLLHLDGLGWHTVCPECESSFDVDVPEGRIVMAFADDSNPDNDRENFTDSFPGRDIRTYYAFDSIAEFKQAWEKMVVDPDGMWYWVLDNGNLICSGACDENDEESFREHFGAEWD